MLGESAGLKIKKVTGMSDGFGGSDHESFYNKGIPVLFAFTGLHSDYHRPSDDSDRINYTGMSRIADYLELITLDLARGPARPSYLKITEDRQAHPRGMSVSLGITPDYGNDKPDGLRITAVRGGGPAEKAGLKGGDRIVVAVGPKPSGRWTITWKPWPISSRATSSKSSWCATARSSSSRPPWAAVRPQ